MTSRRRLGLGGGEVVTLACGDAGGPPRAFTWRGRRYRVRSIEPFETGADPARVNRSWICVRTQTGMRALLSRDPETMRWRMESVLAGKGG